MRHMGLATPLRNGAREVREYTKLHPVAFIVIVRVLVRHLLPSTVITAFSVLLATSHENCVSASA